VLGALGALEAKKGNHIMAAKQNTITNVITIESLDGTKVGCFKRLKRMHLGGKLKLKKETQRMMEFKFVSEPLVLERMNI